MNYQDNIHIDKIRDVIPQDLRTSLVMMEVAKSVLKKWKEYLEILLATFKALHSNKVKGVIFPKNLSSGNSGNGSTPMDIDQADKKKKKKGKAIKQCTHCGKKNHTEDVCYDKRNGKPPSYKITIAKGQQPGTSKMVTNNKETAAAKPKKYKKVICQVESLETDSEDDEPTTSSSQSLSKGVQKTPQTQHISTAHIEEFFDAEDFDDEEDPSANSGSSTPKDNVGFLKRYL